MSDNTPKAPAVTVAYLIRAFFKTLEDEAEFCSTPLTERINGGEDIVELELMDRIAGYAELVEQARQRRCVVRQTEFAGVWDYEITEPFGGVIARCVLSTGNLPDDSWAVQKLGEIIDNSGGMLHEKLKEKSTPLQPGFVVRVEPTWYDPANGRCRVAEIDEASDWTVYTDAVGTVAVIADFALSMKDLALHFAADLAVRLGYGMDRFAVDVVEANEERDLSHGEGWGMFEVDGRWMLQRDDEAGKFADDVDALMWVAQQAIDGSARHRVALRKIGSLA